MESIEHNPAGGVVEQRLQMSNVWNLARKESYGRHSGVARHATGYVIVITTCGLIIWLTFSIGKALEIPAALTNTQPQTIPAAPITSSLYENLRGPLGILLMQIVAVVLAGRMLSLIASRFRQPPVIGEMLAGILLGPSFLGLMSPAAMGFLFPPSSMDTLRMFSQVGIILFMFLIGIDLDTVHLYKHVHTAVLVSHASIIFPFTLATILSLFTYRSMAPASTSFTAFALFMGIAMSITAFPVLARIIFERDLTRSHPGTVSLGCAAVDDISAWCILCVLVSIVKADGMAQPFIVVALVLVYIAVMIFLLRPSLRRLLPRNPFSDAPLAASNYNSWAAVLLAFALSSGLATEIIGVRALFGAFLAGTIIPAGNLRTYCKERFEVVVSGLLLPLFFAFTGLRTQITLLDSARAWLICAAVLIVAVSGKLGGSMLAARWSGMDWNDSFVVGVLMNTRGLMELIVLNIGFDLGIISAQMFAMLVLMALISTVMTAPLLTCTKSDTIRN